MTTLAIVGSRYWTDYAAFLEAIHPHAILSATIVSGGAPGVDTMAERFAFEFRKDVVVHNPEARANGLSFTAAAHRRNQLIVDQADRMIAMPGPKSKGTYDAIRRAQKKGIPIVVIEAPV